MVLPEDKPLELAKDLGAEVGRESAPVILKLTREALLVQASKPGASTSEYKMSALLVIAGLVMVALGEWADKPDLSKQGGDLVAIVGAGYAVSRGLAKAGAGMGANKETKQ